MLPIVYRYCRGLKHAPRSKKMRKGQVLILEEMMMVTLGILIVAGVIFIFNDVNDKILEFAREQQAEEVNSYVKSYIVTLESMNCTHCHITLEIPEQIGGRTYTILGEGDKKKILIHDNEGLWNEKDLSVELFGLSQGSRMLRLEYNDGIVMMRGVDNY